MVVEVRIEERERKVLRTFDSHEPIPACSARSFSTDVARMPHAWPRAPFK